VKRIVPREAAEQDIDDAVDFYADTAGPDVAWGFVAAVQAAYRVIGEQPGMGSPRYADLIEGEGLRHRKLTRYPYLVFYIERVDHIAIWRVLHAKRDIPSSLADPAG
jgi:toxin ParE1/3/4